MHRLNRKSGFTLIEIIVVLIIVGVLAAIALPNMFGQVERNRAQEALATLGSIKDGVESCIMLNNNAWNANCTNPAATGFVAVVGAQFTYAVAAVAAPGMYTITATRVGIVANTVTFTRTAATSAIICAGAGAYAGVCA